MSKRITYDMTYDATQEQVLAMLADPAFREEVCDYQGVLRKTVTVERTASGMDVVIDQFQSVQGLPSFATKLVGEEVNVIQRESWTGGHGDIEVTIPGKPGDMTGTAILSESGGTTTEKVDMTIKVGIPLVGGKIEGLIAELLLEALKGENKVGRDYLAR